ncbi:Hypothetical_protein [Hexamita inflata]|uniref:Hypothetical_protein n=1 Tax=Hexamita inflata TaxID=28002 RepID=A0AA86RK43_9EUKA|nr:Hypothetical protein HINF_LOCUS63973 [Hexamita inflata]
MSIEYTEIEKAYADVLYHKLTQKVNGRVNERNAYKIQLISICVSKMLLNDGERDNLNYSLQTIQNLIGQNVQKLIIQFCQHLDYDLFISSQDLEVFIQKEKQKERSLNIVQ